MKELAKLLPKKSGKHGTRIGWHFIKSYIECPYRWYSENLAPHPGGAAIPSANPGDLEDLLVDEQDELPTAPQAIVSPPGRGYTWLYTPVPIWIGGAFHSGREGWLLSGWRDGKFDPDAGRLALEKACLEKRPEISNHDDWIKAKAEVELLLEGYMRWTGPEGPDPQWERARIIDIECPKCKGTGYSSTLGSARMLKEEGGPWDGTCVHCSSTDPIHVCLCDCDHGRAPLIEHEWEIDLGHENYFYTTRVDAVVLRCADDVLSADECKTCDTGRASADYRAWKLDPQLTGEQYALEQTWGSTMRCGVNLDHVIKRAGKGDAKRGRPPRNLRDFHILDRNEGRLENFRRQMVRTLIRLDEDIALYRDYLSKGIPEDQAGRLAFSSEVPGSTCAWCIMADVCDLNAAPIRAASSTKPKHVEEETK